MKHSIYLLFVSLFFFSCAGDKEFTDDTPYAEYDNDLVIRSLEKFSNEELDAELSKMDAIDLTPGLHTVHVDVDPKFVAGGIQTQRLFSYYIPENLQDNYDVVFELHGNFNYNPELTQMSTATWMSDVYKDKNAILVLPLGSVKKDATTSDVYGWYVDNGDLNFIDMMLRYFEVNVANEAGFNMNPSGIFSTGQSSGAIFSWAMSYYRSEVFSAVVPRHGMVRIQPEMTIGNGGKSKVPMRVILGEIDEIVDHEAALDNADAWAKKILGIEEAPGPDSYFTYCIWYSKKDPATSSYSVGSKRTWQNGDALLETYSLPKMGHGHLGLIADYEIFVYDFFNANRKEITQE